MTTQPWFDGREMVREIPAEAIDECTIGGRDASESVADWVRRLEFSADPDLTREYLSGFGAWDADELADDAQNVQRLFWVVCGYLAEESDYPIYLEA